MSSQTERLVVALVGVSSPGYRSLANAYLSQCVKRDPRLPEIWMTTPEFDTSTDPWWIAYQLLDLDPVPDVIGFSVVCWNARVVFEAIRVIKAARPSLYIVVGGPEVGPLAEQTLAEQPGIDAVVRGEGEFALPELLHSFVRGGDQSSVPGVSARVGERIASGPDRAQIEDMDSIPSPYPAGVEIPTDGSAFLETYRGCPHQCAYCYEGKGSTRIRSFSWERIAADIERVASVPGMRSFSFIDPVFNLTPDRLARLSGLLAPWVECGLRLHTVEVDIERVDDDAAALLARAGVVSVETGPQSIGEAALAQCRRAFNKERFLAGVAACKRVGISVECDLIVGLPDDTVEDVLEGIRFVLAADPGKIQLSTLHVLPGTDLWSRAEALGLAFDHEPSHELISTLDIGFTDLRRLEVLGNATASIYRARLIP